MLAYYWDSKSDEQSLNFPQKPQYLRQVFPHAFKLRCETTIQDDGALAAEEGFEYAGVHPVASVLSQCLLCESRSRVMEGTAGSEVQEARPLCPNTVPANSSAEADLPLLISNSVRSVSHHQQCACRKSSRRQYACCPQSATQLQGSTLHALTPHSYPLDNTQ